MSILLRTAERWQLEKLHNTSYLPIKIFAGTKFHVTSLLGKPAQPEKWGRVTSGGTNLVCLFWKERGMDDICGFFFPPRIAPCFKISFPSCAFDLRPLNQRFNNVLREHFASHTQKNPTVRCRTHGIWWASPQLLLCFSRNSEQPWSYSWISAAPSNNFGS